MTESFAKLTQKVTRSLGELRTSQPDVMRGFGSLGQAAMRDGTLSRKTKELIALALGVAAHCDACIGFHVQALVKLGATREEIDEVLGVTVYMGGGPSAMYAANAISAFNEMAATVAA